MHHEDNHNELSLLPQFRTFMLFWLILASIFWLATLIQSEPFHLRQPERLRRSIQVAVALIVAVYIHIPWLEKQLGRLFLPLALIILSGGSLAALYVPFDASRANLPDLLEFVFGITRPIVIWIVTVIILCWQHDFRLAIGYSVLMGSMFTMAVIQIDNLRTPFIVDQFTMSLFLAGGFSLVGYFVARLSSIERQRRLDLAASNRKLADYASTLEQLTISRERNRLARELHDTLAHTLSGLAVQMETIRRYWDVDPATAKELFEKSVSMTRDGLDETRRALTTMRASPLEELGLLLALVALANSAKSRAHLQLNLDLPEEIPTSSPAIEQAIYRIAQEAIANVVKRATAQTLTVRLHFGEEIELMIADDGVGFVVETQPPTEHFGLIGLQERAALIGGRVAIQSQLGQGTMVNLTV
ncbi:MAG: sensor histidine kinase [Chloroflexota bacterium]